MWARSTKQVDGAAVELIDGQLLDLVAAGSNLRFVSFCNTIFLLL